MRDIKDTIFAYIISLYLEIRTPHISVGLYTNLNDHKPISAFSFNYKAFYITEPVCQEYTMQ